MTQGHTPFSHVDVEALEAFNRDIADPDFREAARADSREATPDSAAEAAGTVFVPVPRFIDAHTTPDGEFFVNGLE